MLKNFGSDLVNKAIIDFLANNDKLFALSQNELQNAKAILGSDITAKDIIFHNLGYSTLKKLAEYDVELMNKSEADILTILNDRLSAFTSGAQTLI